MPDNHQSNSSNQIDQEFWTQSIPNDALKNKIILVSGAAGDLGSQLARDCAALGATMILMDKKTKQLEQLFDQIQEAGYPEPVICPIDMLVAQPGIYSDLQRQLTEQFGALHGLVHCAALFDIPSPVADLEAVTWQQQIHVNLTAAYLLTSHLLPLLQQTTNSRIIFISDSSARNGTAYWGAYGVAKAGLEQFAQTLAEELDSAEKVRVNTVIPGPINSRLRKITFPGEVAEKRIAIEQITPFFLRLLSESGHAVHGQTIHAHAVLENQHLGE